MSANAYNPEPKTGKYIMEIYVFALILDIVVDEIIVNVPVYDEDGVYYGLQADKRKCWKNGSRGKSALGYFTKEDDAIAIKDALEKNDEDVARGRVVLTIVRTNLNKLGLYDLDLKIMPNLFYPEGCVNGYCEKFKPMSPSETLKFLK